MLQKTATSKTLDICRLNWISRERIDTNIIWILVCTGGCNILLHPTDITLECCVVSSIRNWTGRVHGDYGILMTAGRAERSALTSSDKQTLNVDSLSSWRHRSRIRRRTSNSCAWRKQAEFCLRSLLMMLLIHAHKAEFWRLRSQTCIELIIGRSTYVAGFLFCCWTFWLLSLTQPSSILPNVYIRFGHTFRQPLEK